MRSPLQPPKTHLWRLSDGYTLAGRLWPRRSPADAPPPTEAVLYLHGIQSHGGWYEWSASVLADAGLPVVLPDRRGSGRNEQDRGDVRAARQWLADLDELYLWLCEHWRVTQVALVAVSWGGKLALAWARRRPQLVSRLLLIAPGLFPRVDVGPLTRLRIGQALLWEARRPFPIPLNDPTLFTDNPHGRKFIADDPQKLTSATARWLYQSAQLDRWWRTLRPGALPGSTDLLLMKRDRIIHNERTERFLEKILGEKLTVQRFDAAHTIEFEPVVTPFETALRKFASDRQRGANTDHSTTSSLLGTSGRL